MLIALTTLVLRAQENENAANAKIIALEQAWNLAETSGDSGALDALFDHNLVYVDVDGTQMTKSEVLAHVKSVHPQQLVTESLTVQVFGDTAIVNGSYRAHAFKNGKMVVSRGRFTDTWLFRDSRWVCITAQATPIAPPGAE